MLGLCGPERRRDNAGLSHRMSVYHGHAQETGSAHCPPERPVCGHSQAQRGPPPPQPLGAGPPRPPSDKALLPGGHGELPASCRPAPPAPLPAGAQAAVGPPGAHPGWSSGPPSEAPGAPGAPKPAAPAQPPGWPGAFLPGTRVRRSSCRQTPPHSGIERELLVALRDPDHTRLHTCAHTRVGGTHRPGRAPCRGER